MCQQLIEVLMWSIELIRIDILKEVSYLSQNWFSPKYGHIDAFYLTIGYLNKNQGDNPGRMTYNLMYEPIDQNVFGVAVIYLYKWKDLYPDAQEMIPINILEALGKYFVIRYYVDANHAGNIKNRMSHSDIIIYVNNLLIRWYIKRHSTVEASSFGSYFVDLRISTYIIEALRYK